MNTEQSEICPLRLAMDVVGGKWRLSIICLLKDGKPLRYNQIKWGVPGITNVMLSQSLKHLEEYGIVSRRQYNEVPVRVEYQLTNNGKTLLDLLEQFSEWGNQYISRHQEYRSHCTNCLFRDREDF
ncbi:helix-turn-helix domain-containing protein [Intestinimonas aquisgranensis]|nr:helix-turn-helix transcriptional regulator [Intestinimonas aquisgranensis]